MIAATRSRWGIVTLVGVIALVALLSISTFRAKIVDTKETDARFGLTTIRQALELYKKDHGEYPNVQESLAALCDQPGQRRGYLVCPHALRDPWGNSYVYKSSDAQRGGEYQLYSRGPNGIDENGRGDDIVKPVDP